MVVNLLLMEWEVVAGRVRPPLRMQTHHAMVRDRPLNVHLAILSLVSPLQFQMQWNAALPSVTHQTNYYFAGMSTVRSGTSTRPHCAAPRVDYPVDYPLTDPSRTGAPLHFLSIRVVPRDRPRTRHIATIPPA